MLKKTYKKQQEESQIVWKNSSPDVKFNPLKRWYGVITVGDKNFITEYESKFRSEVTALFEEEARLANGQLTAVGVFK